MPLKNGNKSNLRKSQRIKKKQLRIKNKIVRFIDSMLTLSLIFFINAFDKK